jgi:Uri superfamily endonuclease
LIYQKYILFIAVGLWIGDYVKVKPDGSSHYEAAKTQSGIHALVGSAVSHFADRRVHRHGVSFGKFSTILQAL